MQKLLTGLAAASVLALLASAAQAACDWHQSVTASADQSQQAVAMSTHDGAPVPPPVVEDQGATEAAATPVCSEDEEECVPASE
jgi:hypothetical protein